MHPSSTSGGSAPERSASGTNLPFANLALTNLAFARALAISIIAGALVAWTPRLWGVSVLHTAVLLLAAAWMMFRTPHYRKRYIAPLLIAAWGAGQLVLSLSLTPWATRMEILNWFTAAVGFVLAAEILRGKIERAAFLETLAWSAATLAVLAVIQMYSSPGTVFWLFPAEDKSVGTFLYKNQFAAFLELAAPISLYWAMFSREKRTIGIVTFLAIFGGVVMSASRAGVVLILAEFVAASVVAFFRKAITRKTLLLLLPGTAAILWVTALIAGIDALWNHFQEAHSYSLREELLVSTVRMVKDHPWLGYGLGSWSTVYPQYASFDIGLFANQAHNDWVQWPAEGGVVFAGLMLWFVVRILPAALRSVWGLGFIAVALHSWVDYPTREPVVRVLWFVMAGALTAARDSKSFSTPRKGKALPSQSG